tara:strand:- start:2040 stop:2462 length:423 start_codon:yes stop_codon:yes gene_type:complete
MTELVGGFQHTSPCWPETFAARDKVKGKPRRCDDEGVHILEAWKCGSEKIVLTKEFGVIDFEIAPNTLQLSKSVVVYFSFEPVIDTMGVNFSNKNFDFLDASREPWARTNSDKSAHVIAIYPDSEMAIEEPLLTQDGKSF